MPPLFGHNHYLMNFALTRTGRSGCEVGGAATPRSASLPSSSSTRLTAGGRRTGEGFTNGGGSGTSFCLD